MAKFSTTVNLSPKDVAELKKQGYSLYGFKAVEASGGGEPTVWFKLDTNKLLTSTTIEWEEEYQGYNSTSQISDDTVITATNTIPTDLGNLITIENSSGNLADTTNGLPGAVSFLNEDSQQFTVGINQMVDGESNTLCAFPILGSGAARVITPITKIALIFSTAQIVTSTVITKAMSSGALVNLTGVNSRTVDFSLDQGWTAGGASYLSTFNAFTSMSSLLIESPSNSADKQLSNDMAA